MLSIRAQEVRKVLGSLYRVHQNSHGGKKINRLRLEDDPTRAVVDSRKMGAMLKKQPSAAAKKCIFRGAKLEEEVNCMAT